MKKYLIILSLAAFIIAGCSENVQDPNPSLQKSSLEKNSKVFTTHLSGSYEVPPVDTRAQGEAIFKLSADGTELYYKLIVANIYDLHMAHIHIAPPGENGGVAAWLYPSAPPPVLIEGRTDGILAEGVITSADLVGPLEGQSLDDLINKILNDSAYVNVHTEAYPGGEIRGNL